MEEIPSELDEALAVVGSSRQTTWKVELPMLRMPLGGAREEHLEMYTVGMCYVHISVVTHYIRYIYLSLFRPSFRACKV